VDENSIHSSGGASSSSRRAKEYGDFLSYSTASLPPLDRRTNQSQAEREPSASSEVTLRAIIGDGTTRGNELLQEMIPMTGEGTVNEHEGALRHNLQSMATSTVDPFDRPNNVTTNRAASVPKFSRRPVKIDVPKKIGIYGWRKKCLYLLIVILSTLIAINASLIYYFYTLMQVSILEGTLGTVRLDRNHEGILRMTIQGQAFFLTGLKTQNIQSSPGSVLKLVSLSNNITITSSDNENLLTISRNCVDIFSKQLRVFSGNNKHVFSVENDKFTIQQDSLRIKSELFLSFSF